VRKDFIGNCLNAKGDVARKGHMGANSSRSGVNKA
jgi:hypothetical protein